MLLMTWNLSQMSRSLFGRSIKPKRRRPIRKMQLQLERLEDRITPTAQLNFTGPLSDWTIAPTATGNASTDTTNLQNALNQVGTSGHSPALYLPAGTYAINSTLSLASSQAYVTI
jgi:hypothetical protein